MAAALSFPRGYHHPGTPLHQQLLPYPPGVGGGASAAGGAGSPGGPPANTPAAALAASASVRYARDSSTGGTTPGILSQIRRLGRLSQMPGVSQGQPGRAGAASIRLSLDTGARR
jgi:hypothetical protein